LEQEIVSGSGIVVKFVHINACQRRFGHFLLNAFLPLNNNNQTPQIKNIKRQFFMFASAYKTYLQ